MNPIERIQYQAALEHLSDNIGIFVELSLEAQDLLNILRNQWKVVLCPDNPIVARVSL